MAMQWKCKKRLEEWPSLSDVWKVAGVYLVMVTKVGEDSLQVKIQFQNNPSGANSESSYIPWWHYVLQLFSSSAVTFWSGKKENGDFHYHAQQRFYQQQLSHPLTAAACHTTTAHVFEAGFWNGDMTTVNIQSNTGLCVCGFPQLRVIGILEIKIPESQEFIRLSATVFLWLWLVYRKKKKKKTANQLGDNIWKSVCLFCSTFFALSAHFADIIHQQLSGTYIYDSFLLLETYAVYIHVLCL